MGTDQSSTNDADVDKWENEGGTYSPLPAGSSIANDPLKSQPIWAACVVQ